MPLSRSWYAPCSRLRSPPLRQCYGADSPQLASSLTRSSVRCDGAEWGEGLGLRSTSPRVTPLS